MSLGYHNLQKLVVTVNFSIKKPVYEYVKKNNTKQFLCQYTCVETFNVSWILSHYYLYSQWRTSYTNI